MVSLIITVKNEIRNIEDWFRSVTKQERIPDEIVIVDGGSVDGTWEWLKTVSSDSVRIFQHKGNIASGRNYAIHQAHGEIIVTTDAGCVYRTDWFKKIVEPIEDGRSACTSTAFSPWLSDDDSVLLYTLAAATTPAQSEFNNDWLPSSRSCAFLKKVWEDVGGYPEWIPYCEDVVFDLLIQKNGTSLYLVREPLVSWRPRLNVGQYMKQVYNYTRSDAHGKLFYIRQAIRYVVYSGLIMAVYFSFVYSAVVLMPVFVAGFVYMSKFWKRFFEFSKSKKIPVQMCGFVLLPLIVMLGDMAKMTGWIVGLCERWSRKIKYQAY